MKKLIVVIMLILSVGCAMAQHTADLGVQVGAATYWGDIHNVNTLKSITPVVGVLGRWNFNKRLAVRGQLLTGNLSADGFYKGALIGQSGYRPITTPATFPADPNYVYNFKRNFQTAEALLEFNFRNYKLGKMKKEAFTPFVTLGLGVFYSRAPRTGSFILDPPPSTAVGVIPALYPPYLGPAGTTNSKLTNGFDVSTLTIPVGAGLKFNITKRLGGMAEVIIRKTFSDNIDNLNDPSRYLATSGPSYAAAKTGLNNTDWYATLAVSLTYQLWDEKGNCALYDKLRRK